jgi:carboxypeptidase C (cathepsin A)
MWVDQPAGVGFSTGIGTHNEQGVANNMFVSLIVTVVIFWLF